MSSVYWVASQRIIVCPNVLNFKSSVWLFTNKQKCQTSIFGFERPKPISKISNREGIILDIRGGGGEPQILSKGNILCFIFVTNLNIIDMASLNPRSDDIIKNQRLLNWRWQFVEKRRKRRKQFLKFPVDCHRDCLLGYIYLFPYVHVRNIISFTCKREIRCILCTML